MTKKIPIPKKVRVISKKGKISKPKSVNKALDNIKLGHTVKTAPGTTWAMAEEMMEGRRDAMLGAILVFCNSLIGSSQVSR